jgi:hypothetical protein
MEEQDGHQGRVIYMRTIGTALVATIVMERLDEAERRRRLRNRRTERIDTPATRIVDLTKAERELADRKRLGTSSPQETSAADKIPARVV